MAVEDHTDLIHYKSDDASVVRKFRTRGINNPVDACKAAGVPRLNTIWTDEAGKKWNCVRLQADRNGEDSWLVTATYESAVYEEGEPKFTPG